MHFLAAALAFAGTKAYIALLPHFIVALQLYLTSELISSHHQD